MHTTTLLLIIFSCFFLLVAIRVESKTSLITEKCLKNNHHHHHRHVTSTIGVVIDERSRLGKQQKVGLQMALHDFHNCSNLRFYFKYSYYNSASSAIELVSHNQVDAIIGTMTLQEAALFSEFKKVTRNIPIISISPTPSTQHMSQNFQSFIQMNNHIAYQAQCIAAIVSHFRWQKVISIYEQDKFFSADSGIITHLSDSLQAVHSSVEHHLSFPGVSSLSDPGAFIEQELKKLRSKNTRIFLIIQSSSEFSAILFEKAKRLGMMEKGYVWIVSDEIANLLDSIELEVILNMQGVIGLKTDYVDKSDHFKEFKSRFRRIYRSEYPEAEEENSNPSLYALRAYDAFSTMAKAIEKTEGKIVSRVIDDHFLSSDYKGMSGEINFKNGLLSHKPIFRIVNVIGKSYNEVATYSPEFDEKGVRFGSGLVGELSSIHWPGGEKIVPKRRKLGSKEKPLSIAVPGRSAFNQFVKVANDSSHKTNFSGFSIDVFKAAVRKLPYTLHLDFFPYYGPYDDMVAAVNHKGQGQGPDAAVGDTSITAERYMHVEFSQPYIECSVVMVVTEKPQLKESGFIALNPFTEKMWIQLVAMSMLTGAIIWLSEYAAGNEEFTMQSFLQLIGSILWLSVTVLSQSQRENITSMVSKLVVAAWLCVVFVVAASFTAVLSSIMTVPRIHQQPSVLDINYLLNTDAKVGCNQDSFIHDFLQNELQFKPENIKRYESFSDYPGAFEKGYIKAAFFVQPHAKVFLAVNCQGYTISGPSYKLGGFGFVFPKGSPLAIDISEALLKITQSGEVDALLNQMLSSYNCSSTKEEDSLKLGPGPLSGLFKILGGIIGFAFIISITRLARTHWTIIHDLVQKALMINRISLWASLVLAECYTRFCSTFFRGINGIVIEMEPNLMAIQLAANHSISVDEV